MAERKNRVPEDAVEYLLFPNLSNPEKGPRSNSELLGYIENFLTSLSPYLIDVIWQNEGFKLKPIQESGKSKVKRLFICIINSTGVRNPIHACQ